MAGEGTDGSGVAWAGADAPGAALAGADGLALVCGAGAAAGAGEGRGSGWAGAALPGTGLAGGSLAGAGSAGAGLAGVVLADAGAGATLAPDEGSDPTGDGVAAPDAEAPAAAPEVVLSEAVSVVTVCWVTVRVVLFSESVQPASKPASSRGTSNRLEGEAVGKRSLSVMAHLSRDAGQRSTGIFSFVTFPTVRSVQGAAATARAAG